MTLGLHQRRLGRGSDRNSGWNRPVSAPKSLPQTCLGGHVVGQSRLRCWLAPTRWSS